MKAFGYRQAPTKYTSKIEAFPDGYRTFYFGKPLETVGVLVKIGGLLQLGLYVSFHFQDLPRAYFKNRVANVQIQKLRTTSIEVQ